MCYNTIMKNILFVMFILLPALAWAQPSVEFKTETHDFGAVAQGPQLEYTFQFTNTGSEELIIKGVNTS